MYTHTESVHAPDYIGKKEGLYIICWRWNARCVGLLLSIISKSFSSGWQGKKEFWTFVPAGPGKKFKRRKVKRIKRRTAPYIFHSWLYTVTFINLFSVRRKWYVQWSSSDVHSWITFEIRKKKQSYFFFIIIIILHENY